jgi:hypothetical protein
MFAQFSDYFSSFRCLHVSHWSPFPIRHRISAAADRAELERRRLVRDAETRQRRAERRQLAAGGDGGALGALGADGGVDDDGIGADGIGGDSVADSAGVSASGRKMTNRGSVAEGGVDSDSGYGMGMVGAGEFGDETPSEVREGGRSASRLGASNVSIATVAV